jgi:release factor glutamine methyltransferase
MTPRRLLTQAVADLQTCGCTTPRLDAELLLCHALDKTRSWLIAHADDVLDEIDVGTFRQLLTRRLEREPVAYITGEKEFWSRSFHVTPDVLIPRPETEHLIEAVLTHFPDTRVPCSFCDIGTGSGCIAITLACEFPQAHITATDISAAALAVAKTNAERHGVTDRIAFFQGDMFAAFDDGAIKGDLQTFDAIVSNPPYVARHEMGELEPELNFEPRHALSDEQDGLTFLRRLVDEAGDRLTPHGLLIVETGLCGLPEESNGMRLQEHITDLAGHLRGGVYSR